MKRILALVLIVLSSSVFAQGGMPLKTGKKYVIASVDPGSGWVTIREFPGNYNNGIYSYYQKSFVSFLVSGKVFTNNDVGLPSPLPENTVIIKDGVLSKIDDTVRCIWKNKGGMDLIQDVYPVFVAGGEQIIFRWKAKNNGPGVVTVAVQYILELQVGDNNYANDAPMILTNNGLTGSWSLSDTIIQKKIPPYFLAFQQSRIEPPQNPSFGNKEYVGTGFFDSVYTVGLKLRRPSRVITAHWPDLIPLRWILSDLKSLPNGQYQDGCIAAIWPITGILTGNEREVASMSYGTSNISICFGNTNSLNFYPKTITFTGKPRPDTFVLESEFHLPNLSVLPKSDLQATLFVGKNLRIISPTPVINNGQMQKQTVSNNGDIRVDTTCKAKWTIKIDTVGIGKSDFSSSYTLSLSSQDGTEIEPCENIISFDLPDYDSLPPVFTELSPLDSSTRRISFSEIRTLDSGLKSISWTFATPEDSSNLVITPQQIVGACMKGIDTITIFQKDTTNWGCIDFVAIDCAGNKTETKYCVPGKVYVPVDTLPPYTTDHKTKDKLTKELTVVDPFVNSSYIKSVEHLPPPTLPSFNQSILFNTNCTMSGGRIIVQRVDSLQEGCVYYTITDCANNSTRDSICFVADTSLGVTDTQDENTFSILGNPSSGKATIHLTLAKPQDVTLRIVDAIGREVRRVDVKGLSQGENLIPLQTSELASGTYYVIVEIDGKQLAKSLKVVR